MKIKKKYFELIAKNIFLNYLCFKNIRWNLFHVGEILCIERETIFNRIIK